MTSFIERMQYVTKKQKASKSMFCNYGHKCANLHCVELGQTRELHLSNVPMALRDINGGDSAAVSH